MSTKNITSLRGQLAAYLILALVLVLVAGLLTTNYSAAIALMVGSLLSWPARRVFVSLVAAGRRLTRSSWLKIVAVLFVLLLILLAYGLLRSLARIGSSGADCSVGPIVEKYNAVIEPVSFQAGKFTIKETVTNPCPVKKELLYPDGDVIINLPERQVNSSPRGLLLKEVSILPLESSSGVVNLQLEDGSTLSGPLCASRCPESKIELRDLPRESFYAAKGAENLARSPYIDIEKITWSVQNLQEGVIFAYIPPPFQYLRPIIGPFAGASSASQFIAGFFGLIGAAIVTPIMRPVILGILQKRFGSWLEKLSGTKPQEEIRRKKKTGVSEKKPKR